MECLCDLIISIIWTWKKTLNVGWAAELGLQALLLPQWARRLWPMRGQCLRVHFCSTIRFKSAVRDPNAYNNLYIIYIYNLSISYLSISFRVPEVFFGQLFFAWIASTNEAWQDCRTVISFLMGALVCHCARTSRGCGISETNRPTKSIWNFSHGDVGGDSETRTMRRTRTRGEKWKMEDKDLLIELLCSVDDGQVKMDGGKKVSTYPSFGDMVGRGPKSLRRRGQNSLRFSTEIRPVHGFTHVALAQTEGRA